MRRSFLLVALLVAGCGSDGGEQSGGAGDSAGETVQLVAKDFAFDPATATVDQAGSVTFRVQNEGGTAHALEVEGNGVEEETDPIGPGESAELTVQLDAGEYELYCPIGNHREMGMEGKLVVGGGGAAGDGSTTGKTETDGGDEDYGYGG
jgi:plastocyanin